MSTTRTWRRRFSVLATGALAVAGLSVTAPAQAAPATTTGTGPSYVDDATFVWGVSGYAQKGVFGPWTFKDLTGNVTLLNGSSQTEYSTAPVPATSFPTSAPNPKANAVKFTDGVGTIDEDTGAGKLSWTGKYVVNAYPPQFNAPNETYEDPILTVAANGSGTLSVDFSIGAGVDVNGNPFEAEDFGRLTLMAFDAGSLSGTSDNGYRVTPDYQGVTNGLSGHTTSCSTSGGATGWWGSWPQPFINALNSHPAGQSVLPHFYSTGCGGMQDNKPALPFDVTFDAKHPTVNVSETALNADGSQTITVTGENFHPSLATGTRPPLSGKPAGTYVAFGKFAENWRPSQGASSSSRKTATAGSGGLKWAVLAENLGAIGGTNAGGITLSPDGDFTAELTIDKGALDAIATDPALTNYGIYTYPGSGGVAPAYETYTPLTFEDEPEPDTVNVGDATVVEGDYGSRNATFTVSLSQPRPSAVSVKYATANGTATAPADYTAKAATALSFAAGQTSKTVTVPVKGDLVAEDDETFSVVLSSPVGVAIGDGTGTATISDDEPAVPHVSVADVSVTEGTGGAKNAVFTLSLTNAAKSTVSVKAATANGTAAAPADFTAKSPTVVGFTAGQTSKTFTVALKPDAFGEPDETFGLVLSAPVGVVIDDGQATATIVNDDAAAPEASVSDVSVAEGAAFGTKNLVFTVQLSAPAQGAVSLKYKTVNGTATAPSDFTAKALTALSFSTGQKTKTVTVQVKGDALVEPDESFELVLSDASAGVTIDDGTATGTITNDD